MNLYDKCNVNCEYLTICKVGYELYEYICMAQKNMPRVNLCVTVCPYKEQKESTANED